MPVVDLLGGGEPISLPAAPESAGEISLAHRLSLCFTCGECSSACPAAVSREVFDPRSIFRMLALGKTNALLDSFSIRLCLSCRRCTEACTQTVRGREATGGLRTRAVEEGVVDFGFPHRLQRADRLLYDRLIHEIDTCLSPETSADERLSSAPTKEFL